MKDRDLMETPEIRERARISAIGKAVRECNGNYREVAEKFGISESAVKEVYEKRFQNQS